MSTPLGLYSPLAPNHIRVAEITPSQIPQGFRVRLIPCRLVAKHRREGDDLPEFGAFCDDLNIYIGYLALSYTWTDYRVASAPEFVQIDVEDLKGGQFKIPVTESLVEAIQTLLEQETTGPLWIDQISIDQSNETEKVAQILQMRQTFEHAAEVVAWLGPASQDSHLGLEIIKNPSRTLLEGQVGILDQGLPLPNFWLATTESFYKRYPSEFVAAEKLLQRAYWERAWIWQEATASPSTNIRMLCGQDWARLDDFFTYAVGIFYRATLSSGNVEKETAIACLRVISIRWFWSERTKIPRKVQLYTLLQKLREAKATDPRDKLLMMLPFATDVMSEADLLLAGSVTVETLFISLVPWYVNRYGVLDFLDYCISITDQQPTLPSWVPDWRQQKLTP